MAKIKAEYIPPKEDVIIQNETPDDVYIIVSGEVEIIDCEMEVERTVGTLHCGSMFGEVGALCCRNQNFTYRTKTLSQLLRLKTSVLQEAMHVKQEDSIVIVKNFLQVRISSFEAPVFSLCNRLISSREIVILFSSIFWLLLFFMHWHLPPPPKRGTRERKEGRTPH